jgi:hypothetical protein
MVWRRGFPHLMNDGKRVHYAQFIADMQSGAYIAGNSWTPYNDNPSDIGDFIIGLSPIFQTNFVQDAPLIWLRWSDDRGATFGNPIKQTMGATGKYLAQPQWRRLGMARDRIFELYGTIPGPFALNGAFIEVMGMGT